MNANTEYTGIQDTAAPSVTPMGTNHIAKALAAAQLEMKNPGFDTTNPHFKNKFASLAAVRNATIPVLAKHGIAVVQDLVTDTSPSGAPLISCFTRLYHDSGQSLVFGPLMMPATKPDAQGLGSAATYCKRYSLQAVCGVVGDDDDDGNAASAKLAETNGKALGDRSGRPDTSRVDPDVAQEYAQSMWDIVQAGSSERAIKLHFELNEDDALYTAANDLYKAICQKNKFSYGGQKWADLTKSRAA